MLGTNILACMLYSYFFILFSVLAGIRKLKDKQYSCVVFLSCPRKANFFMDNKHEYIKGFNKVVKLAVPYGEGNHRQVCVGL